MPHPAIRHRRRATLGALLVGVALAVPVSAAEAMCPSNQVCEPEPAPARPDLVIVRTAGNSLIVKNVGNAPVGAFTVHFAGTRDYSGFQHADWSPRISGLAVGEFKAFGFQCSGYSRVTVDYNRERTESREDNNIMTGPNGRLC
jgi:hypothetical protein